MPTPIHILAVDVGTGTQDILLFESGKTIENCFKLVMPSPTVIVAERIKRATQRGQPILLTGVTMGGGPCHWAARDPEGDLDRFETPDPEAYRRLRARVSADPNACTAATQGDLSTGAHTYTVWSDGSGFKTWVDGVRTGVVLSPSDVTTLFQYPQHLFHFRAEIFYTCGSLNYMQQYLHDYW